MGSHLHSEGHGVTPSFLVWNLQESERDESLEESLF